MSAGPKMAVLWPMAQPYQGEGCVLGGGGSDLLKMLQSGKVLKLLVEGGVSGELLSC